MKRAVVLLSGGVDSTTALAIARAEGFACHCLSLDYGQRHRRELEAASAVARALGAAEHRVLRIDLRGFGGSALTADLAVPKGRALRDIGRAGEIPITYVPARNTIFLALALGFAESIAAADIYIGVNAVDFSGYPDCRPEFIEAFERMANLGTKLGAEGDGDRIRIHAPLIAMTKAQIVRRGLELGVDFALTFSCYDPDAQGRACGRCDACVLRAEGFRGAGVAPRP